MEFLDRPRALWAHTHPIWRFLIIIILLGALVFFGGHPALTVYRTWKNKNTLADATEALEAQRYTEARDLAIQVLRTDKQREQALPILLSSAKQLKDPRGAEVAFAILQGEDYTAETREEAWETICDTAPSSILLHFWSQLDEEETGAIQYALPILDRLIRDQMIKPAAELIASIPTPRPSEIERRLLRMLVINGTEEAYDELQRRLIQASPAEFKQWISLIDEIPQRHIFPALHSAAVAAGFPGNDAPLDDRLRFIRLMIADQLDRGQIVFEANFAKLRERNSAPIVRWCLRCDQPKAAAECLDFNSPSDEAHLYDLQCQVLIALEDTKTLAKFLDDAPPSAPHWLVHCRQSSLAAKLGDKDLLKEATNDAFQAARDHSDPRTLISLAREAEKRELPELAINAWTEALRRGIGPLPLSSSLKSVIQQLATDHREDDLVRALSTLRQLEPGNPVILIQHHYLAALTGTLDPQAALDELLPLQEKIPNQVPLQCTLALNHLLLEQFDQADALTNSSSIDWFAASPSYRAIRAIVLAATDRKEQAAVFIEDFPWKQLLPSERRVLKGLYEVQLDPPLGSEEPKAPSSLTTDSLPKEAK